MGFPLCVICCLPSFFSIFFKFNFCCLINVLSWCVLFGFVCMKNFLLLDFAVFPFPFWRCFWLNLFKYFSQVKSLSSSSGAPNLDVGALLFVSQVLWQLSFSFYYLFCWQQDSLFSSQSLILWYLGYSNYWMPPDIFFSIWFIILFICLLALFGFPVFALTFLMSLDIILYFSVSRS